jgi:hypothetical protein
MEMRSGICVIVMTRHESMVKYTREKVGILLGFGKSECLCGERDCKVSTYRVYSDVYIYVRMYAVYTVQRCVYIFFHSI